MKPWVPYQAECLFCDWQGPVRQEARQAMADQDHHADSRTHQLAIAARDRGELVEHDPATCRNGDHYGQCSGVTAALLSKRTTEDRP